MNLAAPLEAAGYSAFLQLKREKGVSLTIVRRGKRTSECLVEKTPRRTSVAAWLDGIRSIHPFRDTAENAGIPRLDFR
jgi:hypothetical protein